MRVAILLAAGGSRRFGRADKLLAPIGRQPLLLHALGHTRRAAARVIVVVPSLGGRVGRAVRAHGRVRRVVARGHRAGLSASLAAGLRAVRPIEREIVIFLADMPFAAMPRALRLPAGADAARPAIGGRPGHPLLVRAAAVRGMGLAGDAGLAGRLERVTRVKGHAGHVLDVDTRAALGRARRFAPRPR